MQMIRHKYKSMKFVKSPVPATQKLFNNYLCQFRIHKEQMLLPCICGHKIGACLVDPSSDPSHLRTPQGLKPIEFGPLTSRLKPRPTNTL